MPPLDFTQQRTRANIESARDFISRIPARTDATQRARAAAIGAIDALTDELALERAELERDGRTELELVSELGESLRRAGKVA